MKFNATASFIATLITIVLLILLYQRRGEDESLLGLKLVGYFIVGSFVFSFQHVPIPLGLLICLAAFRPRSNVTVKRCAAVLGLAMMLLGRILPL